MLISAHNSLKSSQDIPAKRDSNRDRGEEITRRYVHWLEHGSDRLEDAWVSMCPHAQTHTVENKRLLEIVDAICTGGPVTVPTQYGSKDIDLAENQKRVRNLYNLGCQEAEILNRGNIAPLLKEMGIQAGPEEVEVVSEQPKGNEKVFCVRALRLKGDTYPVKRRVVYHPPYVMGKARANDAKKWTPGVTFAGLFLGKRDGDNLARVTQLFPIDLDTVDNLAAVKARLREDDQIPLVFTSITGSGLRACAWGPVASDAADYSRLYALVARAICKRHGLGTKIDGATSDVARLCFLPFDGEAALLT